MPFSVCVRLCVYYGHACVHVSMSLCTHVCLSVYACMREAASVFILHTLRL